MPLYEYECDACGQRFELIRRFADPEVDICAACGKGPVRRLLSSPAIQFKGSGWYITDYARKAKDGKAGDGKAADGNAGGEKSTAAAGDAAGDKKSESAAKSDAPSTPTTPSGDGQS